MKYGFEPISEALTSLETLKTRCLIKKMNWVFQIMGKSPSKNYYKWGLKSEQDVEDFFKGLQVNIFLDH